MNKMIKLGLIVLGASALTFTLASANADADNKKPTEMKCQAGKCGGADKKEMKKDAEKKKDETKGKCGQGKCGGK